MKIPTVAEVEQTIGIPAQDWKGRCYEIASLLVKHKLVDGVAVYGHWLGAPGSYFRAKRSLGFVQHGWVKCEEGEVVDPTRWVFEDKDPYIYVGESPDSFSDFVQPCRYCECIKDEHGDDGACRNCDCPSFEAEPWPYDEGGNQLRRRMLRPAPAVEGPRTCRLELTEPMAAFHVMGLLGDADAAREGGRLTERQAHWLGNVPYDLLMPYAGEILAAVERVSPASIPFDNLKRAQREFPELFPRREQATEKMPIRPKRTSRGRK